VIEPPRTRSPCRAASARGGPIEVIKPGDRVYFEAGENHWHGATPGRFMTNIAIPARGKHGPGQ
jgi:quercetin dioxygenase-like cupin family protein